MQITNITDERYSVSIQATALRFSLYTFGILLFAATLPWLAQYQDAAAFKENGALEWSQLGLLTIISVALLNEAVNSPKSNQMLILLACFSAFAATREMDANLDAIVPWIGWKIGYVFIIYAGIVSYRHWDALKVQISGLLNSRAFSMLWAGFIVAIPFAQLVGNATFLHVIMQDDYSRDYQRMIEEIGEFMGYGLLLIGSLELIWQRRSMAKAFSWQT